MVVLIACVFKVLLTMVTMRIQEETCLTASPGGRTGKERKSSLNSAALQEGQCSRYKRTVQCKLREEFHRSGHFADDRLLLLMKEFGVLREG